MTKLFTQPNKKKHNKGFEKILIFYLTSFRGGNNNKTTIEKT